jgi:hypothetical protein
VPDQRRLPGQASLANSARSPYPTRAVVVFLSLMTIILITRYYVPDRAFRDMPWLLVLALIPVLPWLITWAQGMFSILKVGPVEMTFLQIGISVENVAQDLLAISRDQSGNVPPIRKIAENMTSYAEVVVEKTREITASRIPVLPIDLGNGNRWLLPNLYFLAALLESTTRVDLVIFTQSTGSQHDQQRFVGTCSPEGLRVRLGLASPSLEKARQQTLEPRKCLQIDFWSNLKELVDETEKPQWMTVQYLAKLLGQDMQQDRIEANEVDTKSAKLKVIFARQRFIPVVSSTEVEAVTDQYGSALNVARSVLSR